MKSYKIKRTELLTTKELLYSVSNGSGNFGYSIINEVDLIRQINSLISDLKPVNNQKLTTLDTRFVCIKSYENGKDTISFGADFKYCKINNMYYYYNIKLSDLFAIQIPSIIYYSYQSAKNKKRGIK